MSDLIQKLQWRYATKKFNPSKVVPQEKLDNILEATRLTATSSGLQPYEVLVVTNEVRGFKNEGWENYRNMLLSTYPARDAEVNFQHAARQAYIALGTALIAAAEEQVDSTPMEGFDPAALDEILGLRAKGLRSVVILPLGYREAEGDWLVNLKKVRRPTEEFISDVK